MHESNILVAHDLDLVDQAELGELVAEGLLGEALIEAAEVDVARGAGLGDCLEDLRENASQ